jgi:butyrate kinase
MPVHRILVINPGSTSTKFSLFIDEKVSESCIQHHSAAELSRFKTVWDQFEYRLELCRQWSRPRAEGASAVAAIGGLLRPVEGGTYKVNERMLADARGNISGEHASNLGCALAFELGKLLGCPAYVVDPVSVDEFDCLARYSGHPLIERRSLSHVLSLHAAARGAARELGVEVTDSAFIVCHLGGGISIAPVLGGRIVDVNDASSDGPFGPERTGGLPLQQFISLCFSGQYDERAMRTLVMGRGGLVAYLETNSAEEVERRIEGGDKCAAEVFEAMAYQIAKEIGAMSTVLRGGVNAIVLTGGLSRSHRLVDWITERVQFIAPVLVLESEDEMKALAQGVLRVLSGEEKVKEY